MDKLHYSIRINAPKEKVWNKMLGEDTYRQWTEAFMPGSHYVGDWNEGSRILFLAPGDSGQISGMVSRIKENRPYECVSMEHLGIVEDGKEDTSSEAMKGWAVALENYTSTEADGSTVVVDMDVTEEDKEDLEDSWPKALQRLKELAEQ